MGGWKTLQLRFQNLWGAVSNRIWMSGPNSNKLCCFLRKCIFTQRRSLTQPTSDSILDPVIFVLQCHLWKRRRCSDSHRAIEEPSRVDWTKQSSGQDVWRACVPLQVHKLSKSSRLSYNWRHQMTWRHLLPGKRTFGLRLFLPSHINVNINFTTILAQHFSNNIRENQLCWDLFGWSDSMGDEL